MLQTQYHTTALLFKTCIIFVFRVTLIGQSRHQQERVMWQRRRQEEHRQEEARRVERERRLHSGLVQEEGVHRRRYVRQVQEELKERRTESALLKVRYTRLT